MPCCCFKQEYLSRSHSNSMLRKGSYQLPIQSLILLAFVLLPQLIYNKGTQLKSLTLSCSAPPMCFTFRSQSTYFTSIGILLWYMALYPPSALMRTHRDWVPGLFFHALSLTIICPESFYFQILSAFIINSSSLICKPNYSFANISKSKQLNIFCHLQFPQIQQCFLIEDYIFMNKKLEESRHVQSCRIGRASQARIVRSSQMPKDFFSGQQSAKALTKARCSQQFGDEKHIFQQFKSMFKIRKNLQSLALKLSPKSKQIEESVFWGNNKENVSVRLPSLYLDCKISEQKQKQAQVKKKQVSIYK